MHIAYMIACNSFCTFGRHIELVRPKAQITNFCTNKFIVSGNNFVAGLVLFGGLISVQRLHRNEQVLVLADDSLCTVFVLAM